LPEAGDFVQALHAARGSPDAEAELLERYRPYLLVIANDKLDSDLRPRMAASDLVACTIVEAHRDLDAFDGDEKKLRAWLRRILLNNLADARRRENAGRRRKDREEPNGRPPDDIPRDTPSPSERAIAAEELAALDAALGRLSDEHRRVIELRNKQGLPFADVAAALDKSVDAARQLWRRAFRNLKREMRGRDETKSDAPA
jgi:RNA polymerase sigma-70 factor (ECF subfamily)